MSIEVQCPNPDCASVHRVKNRWAGKRGTCPDCGAVIEVPGTPTPAQRRKPAPMPEPDPFDAAVAEEGVSLTEAVEEHATVSDAAEESVAVGNETLAYEPPPQKAGKKEPALDDPFSVEEEVGAVEEAATVGDETITEAPPPKKEKKGKKKPQPEEEATLMLDEGITDDPFAVGEEPRPTSIKAADDDPFGEEIADEAEADEDAEPAPSVSNGKRFSGLTALLYLLGILCLAGAAAVPFLPGSVVTVSGTDPLAVKKLQDQLQDTGGIKPEKRTLVMGVPAGLAALALLGLLLSVLTRHFGVFPLILTYLTWLGSAGLLLMSLALMTALSLDATLTSALKPSSFGFTGITGVKVTVGMNVYVAVGCALGATLLFTAVLPLMHRSLWARIVFGVLAVLVLGLVALIYLVGMAADTATNRMAT